MTPTLLLDTNVISEPMRPRPDERVLARLDEHAESVAISSVTWHELRFGVQRLPNGKRRAALERYLDDVVGRRPILPYDERAAAWHATERVRLERRGIAVPFVDAQIGAVAATLGLTLVTRDRRDFAALRGVTVVTWHA